MDTKTELPKGNTKIGRLARKIKGREGWNVKAVKPETTSTVLIVDTPRTADVVALSIYSELVRYTYNKKVIVPTQIRLDEYCGITTAFYKTIENNQLSETLLYNRGDHYDRDTLNALEDWLKFDYYESYVERKNKLAEQEARLEEHKQKVEQAKTAERPSEVRWAIDRVQRFISAFNNRDRNGLRSSDFTELATDELVVRMCNGFLHYINKTDGEVSSTFMGYETKTSYRWVTLGEATIESIDTVVCQSYSSEQALLGEAVKQFIRLVK